MTNDILSALLAEKVLGWRISPGRFLMGNRQWSPRWRFQPTEKLEDAFRLLEEAGPKEYTIRGDDKGGIHVQVRIGGTAGEARGICKALTIACAIARSVGIEVE